MVGESSMKERVRISGIALLGLVLAAVGCSKNYIPNTDVEDTSKNRDIIRFCEKYRKALERKDVPLLLSMASPKYYEDGGNIDPEDDMDYAGLREWLEGRFSSAHSFRYEIRYRMIEHPSKNRVNVIYTYSASYKIPGLEKDDWQHSVSENRLELEQTKDSFRILAGM
jgi:hypothetical protein